jgi:hypothetical protein
MKKQHDTRKKHARHRSIIRQHRKTQRKQRGGIKCNEPTTWTPFSYSDNSCWLDTFLLAFLHHPSEVIDEYLSHASEHIETMKPHINNSTNLNAIKQHEIILQRLLKIRTRLRQTFNTPATGQALARIRENIRTALSTCPTGIKFEKGKMSSTAEIFEFLTDILDLPRTIRYVEKQGNSPQKDGYMHSITLSGFDIRNMGEILLSNILTKVKKHIDERHPERSIKMQYKRFGDIVPINIERDDYQGGVIQTPVIPEEYISLKTSANAYDSYRLVSITCNVGAHFVTYIACDATESWLFYNDLNPPSERIQDVGHLADWWGNEIPGYRDKYPPTHSTWLLYVKI